MEWVELTPTVVLQAILKKLEVAKACLQIEEMSILDELEYIKNEKKISAIEKSISLYKKALKDIGMQRAIYIIESGVEKIQFESEPLSYKTCRRIEKIAEAGKRIKGFYPLRMIYNPMGLKLLHVQKRNL